MCITTTRLMPSDNHGTSSTSADSLRAADSKRLLQVMMGVTASLMKHARTARARPSLLAHEVAFPVARLATAQQNHAAHLLMSATTAVPCQRLISNTRTAPVTLLNRSVSELGREASSSLRAGGAALRCMTATASAGRGGAERRCFCIVTSDCEGTLLQGAASGDFAEFSLADVSVRAH